MHYYLHLIFILETEKLQRSSFPTVGLINIQILKWTPTIMSISMSCLHILSEHITLIKFYILYFFKKIKLYSKATIFLHKKG